MIFKKNHQWNPKTFSFFKKEKPILIGHRGAPNLAHENTIESFKKAFNANLIGVELDLQLTKDEKLIIFHDWEIIIRNGIRKKISLLNYSEILSNHKTIKIPLLNDLINILPENKFLNIEIKSMKIFNFKLEKKLIKILSKKKILNRVIISSFNPFALYKIKKINPNIFTSFIWTNNHSPLLINTPLWVWLCKPDGFHIDFNYLNGKIIKWTKKKKMAILSYTINKKNDYIKIQKLNIDGVFTDNPYLIK